MPEPPAIDDSLAPGALLMLEYLEGLFTSANREQFNRVDILIIFSMIRDDRELISAEALKEYLELSGDSENV